MTNKATTRSSIISVSKTVCCSWLPTTGPPPVSFRFPSPNVPSVRDYVTCNILKYHLDRSIVVLIEKITSSGPRRCRGRYTVRGQSFRFRFSCTVLVNSTGGLVRREKRRRCHRHRRPLLLPPLDGCAALQASGGGRAGQVAAATARLSGAGAGPGGCVLAR